MMTSDSFVNPVRSITFELTEVSPPNELLDEIAYEKIVSFCLNRKVEACSNPGKFLVKIAGGHPFLKAVYSAYSYHLPLVISPDHIWLLICQGFAQHVHLNSEQLRHRFVEHKGKSQIIINRPDLIKGSPDNDWEMVFSDFSEAIQKQLMGDFYDLLIPTFTTTGAVEKAACEITMMWTFSPFFDYMLRTMCGIPAVTLKGSPADWRALLERTQRLGAYDLEWWTNELIPILEEMVAASEGRVNRDFWERIYSEKKRSGGPFITGWVVKFFPYINQDNSWIHNPCLQDTSVHFTMGYAGTGQAFSPFIWEYPSHTEKMEFVAGFMGVSQDHVTKALRPEIGWAVCYALDIDPKELSRRFSNNIFNP